MTEERATKGKDRADVLHADLGKVERRILSDPIVQQVLKAASQKGLSLHLVGGVIRDILLSRKVKDYDFVLNDAAGSFFDELGDLMGASVFPMGKGKQEQIFRLVKEEKTIDFAVMTVDDIGQDLKRRDFTINAIAYSFAEGRFYADPAAMDDMKEGRIDLVTPQALETDPLRMLRAVRYRCTLPGFDLTERLREEIARRKALIPEVAPERIRGELDAIILSPFPARGLRLMHELGLLMQIFPELAPLEDLPQGRHHATDALSHTIEIVEAVDQLVNGELPFKPSEQERLIVGYAALFHDLGKPATMSTDEKGDIHFYGHPQQSSGLAQTIMRRLKFTNRVKERVTLLVENHMRILTLAAGEPLDKALRRLINVMGEDIRLLLLLGLAETGFKGGEEGGEQERFMGLCRRIWDLYEKEDLVAPEPLLRGRDLLALGYAPGPHMGEILSEVMARQVAGELKDREEALQFVRKEYHP